MTSDENPASGTDRTERGGGVELPAPAVGKGETPPRSGSSPPGDAGQGDDAWLYSGIRLRSASEELEDVYLKKARGLRNAEGEALEARMARAYEIARECLLKLLAPHPADDPSHGRDDQVET